MPIDVTMKTRNSGAAPDFLITFLQSISNLYLVSPADPTIQMECKWNADLISSETETVLL